MPCLRSRAYEMAPTPHVQTYVVATDQVGLKVLRDKVGPHSQHAQSHPQVSLVYDTCEA